MDGGMDGSALGGRIRAAAAVVVVVLVVPAPDLIIGLLEDLFEEEYRHIEAFGQLGTEILLWCVRKKGAHHHHFVVIDPWHHHHHHHDDHDLL